MKARISRYFDITRDAEGRRRMEVRLDGIALLRLPMTNKGTAFTDEERASLGLEGLLPPEINTLEQQAERAYKTYLDQPTPIAKYQFLRGLQERQEILFYKLLDEHLREMLPIVYTPTVGEAVQKFSILWQNARGLSLSTKNIDRAERAMHAFPWEDVRMIVATDSSAILGIGDQGYGGIGICIGKMALYTAAGGLSPFRSMPAGLDVGTERQDLLDDPAYLGVRHKRLRGEEYLAFLDKFVSAVRARWPRAVIQWEDLSKDTAFTVLERYRKVCPSFNDDVQGTGAVTLAGLLNACKLRGESLKDQRIVIHGAGAGGAGVAMALWRGMQHEGLSAEEATKRIFVNDSKGLLIDDRPMESYKRALAQTRASVKGWCADGAIPTLLETIRGAKATVLIGLSGQPGTFDEETVRAMAKNTERPVIFPLSNPTSSCEGKPEEILWWTDGRAIVASGSPFPPVELGGKTFHIGQGNNAFIFPGLGLGAILSDAREITDGMVLEAAYALADYTAERHLDHGWVYPPVEELQEASIRVATRVMSKAIDEGVALTKVERSGIEAYVRARFWKPEYVPFVRAG
jgi:malate dehydrogenase (oxaloacetate-decarboxylating)